MQDTSSNQTVEELARLRWALAVYVDQATSERRPRRPSWQDGPRAVGTALIDWLGMTKAQQRVHDALTDPLGSSARSAIRDVGERLFEIGGLKAMEDSLYSVADADPGNVARRIGIMDRCWDGIGRGPTRQGWCA